MNFRHLEAFVQVAGQGGFTRAAEALYLTQPTVSGQVKELEQELGVPLFDRLPRSVELTEAGRMLLPEARRILDARDRLLQQSSAYLGLLWGRLRVHASTIPGEYLLPTHLAAFRRAHPEVRVVLHVASSAQVLDAVAGGEAALGVVGSRGDLPGLSYLPLWTDRIQLYAPPGLGRGRLEALEELRGVPLVFREEGSGTRRVVEAALGALGLPAGELDVVGEFGSTSAVKEAVRAGFGAAFLSEVAAAGEVRAGSLRPVPVAGLPPVERRFHAVWDGQRSLPPAAQAFLDFLAAAAPG